MEKYKDLERKFNLGDVMIGGNYGEIPTVMIGSIFYMHHKIVKDAETGKFDEPAAADLIQNCERLSEKLGIRFMLDVIGNTSQALVNYIKFIKKVTVAPVLLNSTLSETRIEALMSLADLGILDNVVYNSINAFSSDIEMEALSTLPIETAVVQAYNPGSKKIDSPLKALLGSEKKEGLLEKAKRAGIDKVLVDIPTLDLSSIGTVAKAGELIKEKLGVPVGTAPSNATYASPWLRNKENISTEQFRAVDATINSYLSAHGFNFLFMGPIEGYKWVFPACAVTNAVNIYGMRAEGIKPETSDHPYFKIL